MSIAAEIDIDGELAALELRKTKLTRLLNLRSEVGVLERESMTISGEAGLVCLVTEVVSEHFKISFAELVGRSRRREVVDPRHIIYFLVRELSHERVSLQTIGASFRRDHGGVFCGVRNVRELAQVDPKFAGVVAAVREKCRDRIEANLTNENAK